MLGIYVWHHGLGIWISPTTTLPIVRSSLGTMRRSARLFAVLAGLFSAVAAQDVTEQKVTKHSLIAYL